MRFAKWGNSLVGRLWSRGVQALRSKEGDDVEITVAVAKRVTVCRNFDRAVALSRASS
jgi:antitoxin component of MazEF toxin-antitoxin module